MDITNFPSTADDLAVRALIATYCHKVDAKDTAGVVALFGAEAVLAMAGNEHAGREAINAFYTAIAGNPPGKHLTTNTVLTAEAGNRFSAVSDFVVLRKGDDGKWSPGVVGRYLDVVERKGAEYLFVRREMVIL